MNQNRNINYFHCTINYFYNATRRNVICQNQGLQLHLKPFNEKNGMGITRFWNDLHQLRLGYRIIQVFVSNKTTPCQCQKTLSTMGE
jgi:hypothetical protein